MELYLLGLDKISVPWFSSNCSSLVFASRPYLQMQGSQVTALTWLILSPPDSRQFSFCDFGSAAFSRWPLNTDERLYILPSFKFMYVILLSILITNQVSPWCFNSACPRGNSSCPTSPVLSGSLSGSVIHKAPCWSPCYLRLSFPSLIPIFNESVGLVFYPPTQTNTLSASLHPPLPTPLSQATIIVLLDSGKDLSTPPSFSPSSIL